MRIILSKLYLYFFVGFVVFYLLVPDLLQAKQLISFKDALKLTFPKADYFKREAIYLTKDELSKIQKQVNIPILSRLVICYKAIKNINTLRRTALCRHRQVFTSTRLGTGRSVACRGKAKHGVTRLQRSNRSLGRVKGEKVIGYAYTDTHRVRTLSESILIAFDLKKRIKRVEVLNFYEPVEYVASSNWLDQFSNKPISHSPRIGKDIQGITGASLTVKAIEQAVSRTLAVHKFIIK